MILITYLGVFLLVYGMYCLLAVQAYLPTGKSSRSVGGFWSAICFEFAVYISRKVPMKNMISEKLNLVLKALGQKKPAEVWLLEKGISSVGVCLICMPTVFVYPKIVPLQIIIGLVCVWRECFIYGRQVLEYRRFRRFSQGLADLLGEELQSGQINPEIYAVVCEGIGNRMIEYEKIEDFMNLDVLQRQKKQTENKEENAGGESSEDGIYMLVQKDCVRGIRGKYAMLVVILVLFSGFYFCYFLAHIRANI